MKCGAVAYDGKLCLAFTSAMAENRLPEVFFRFLEDQGIPVEQESNAGSQTGNMIVTVSRIAQTAERSKRLSDVLSSLVFVSVLAIVNGKPTGRSR
ncbi:MAG: hypothetical protein ACLUAR_17760 [Pilosibacter sp.]